ncbi:MAG: hypothetical protein R8G01_01900 [Ilumatobacteraceae bacterium]|nr:hypothetical protein [Ilumatobacteraceae bacterium]
MKLGKFSACALLVMAGCGGGDDPAGDGTGLELPLSIEERCETDDFDRVGCALGAPIPTGTTLVDDAMTVRYVGSTIDRPETGDPVNTSGIEATLYLEVENHREYNQTIWATRLDDRFDGTFERAGSDLVDCGTVPRRGEIEPSQTVTIRFCGYLATVGEIAVDELRFDFAAPCSFCGGLFEVDEQLVDSTVIAAVADTVDDFAAAGFGTPEELGIGDLDVGDETSPTTSEPATEDQADATDTIAPPPPPPPPSSTTATTEPPDTTAPATAAPTTAAPIDDGLVLAADGLGLVAFDAPMGETVAILTDVLGPPDFVSDPTFQPGLGTLATAQWGELRVDFQGGNELFFASYELARPFDIETGDDDEARFVLPEWTPTGAPATATTPDGLRIGMTAADAAELHATVYAPRCDDPMEEMSLTDEHDTIDQLFIESDELGLFFRAPIDGQIWSIGAQVRPNPMLCDGGLP